MNFTKEEIDRVKQGYKELCGAVYSEKKQLRTRNMTDYMREYMRDYRRRLKSER